MKAMLVLVIFSFSNYVFADGCEENFSKATSEEKMALKLEVESNKHLKQIYELAKLDSKKNEVCKLGMLHKEANIQSRIHYENSVKYFLTANKLCKDQFAKMAMENADLKKQQVIIRTDNIKKIDQLLNTQCK